jgi:hypothetical protein
MEDTLEEGTRTALVGVFVVSLLLPSPVVQVVQYQRLGVVGVGPGIAHHILLQRVCIMTMIYMNVSSVTNVISGLGNRSDPRPDRGCLPCMAVGPLSRSATIKGGHVGAREPTFTVPTVPPQTLATKTDQEGAEARVLVHLATNHRPMTVIDTMSSSSSAQGISM